MDDPRTQRIQQLESILEEYKALNERLTSEIDALGWSSGDSSLQTRTALLSDLEVLRREKVEVQEGSSVHLLINTPHSLTQHNPQRSPRPKPPNRPT